MNKHFIRLAPVMALGFPLLAAAQQGADAADAKASSPALRYQSAFADYKPWQDIKPGDWRAVNDNVRDTGMKGGGHASHSMGATPAAAPASAPATKASAPAMSGHQGHHGNHK